jgi:hypothetical protein
LPTAKNPRSTKKRDSGQGHVDEEEGVVGVGAEEVVGAEEFGVGGLGEVELIAGGEEGFGVGVVGVMG